MGLVKMFVSICGYRLRHIFFRWLAVSRDAIELGAFITANERSSIDNKLAMRDAT